MGESRGRFVLRVHPGGSHDNDRPDPVTKLGLFEPVGTHPDFQRKGLGKAVVVEGLRRLKAWGMKQAILCAEHDNPAAQKLYESAGFRTIHKLCAAPTRYTFKKPI